MRSRMNILLVDDDRADRLAIRQILRQAPFDTNLTEAESVPEAIQKLGNLDAISAIILDYRLTGDDGLTLLREIRRREADKPEQGGVPVIVLTGRGGETVAVEAMKAGATDYVPKSELSVDRLASAIRTGLEIHARRAEAARAALRLKQANDGLERRVRQRTADLQKAVEELRRRNDELDEFTYVASHDLQEPLRKLMAFSKLLPSDVGGELPHQAQQDLDYIVDAARRMQALVQDLLTLSRTGKAEIKRSRISLESCAERAMKALSTRIEETSAEITRDELPLVMGDPSLLTQLYQNLIGNALKFFAQDRRPRIRLTAEQTEDGWVFGVRDNGIGLKPEYSEQIFAPFKRLHGRDEYEGTGIGLSVCRKAVERLGGRIWVESRLNEGAHFKFTLGENPEEQECIEEAAGQPLCC